MSVTFLLEIVTLLLKDVNSDANRPALGAGLLSGNGDYSAFLVLEEEGRLPL
jgi:hypothetical protein